MICDGVYDENQREIVIGALLSARRSILIAVAWINFDEYGDTFLSLLEKGVHIKIVVNEDIKNLRYKETIEALCAKGLEIKMIRMPKNSQYMHHKFCVVDNIMCLMGSFNWTKNANNNNFEDLSISHQDVLVKGFYDTFNSLWELSEQDFLTLRNPLICEQCGEPHAYLCVFEQDGYNETKADLYQVCGCGDLKFIGNEFFTVHLCMNIMGIFDKYSDMEEYYHENGYEMDRNEIKRQLDFEIGNYLTGVRETRMGMPIIHAVGIYGQRLYYENFEERFIQVLWKERYTSKYILDEYPIA